MSLRDLLGDNFELATLPEIDAEIEKTKERLKILRRVRTLVAQIDGDEEQDDVH